MNVLQNLTELYNHLSFDSTYRNVCKGILENMEEVCEWNDIRDCGADELFQNYNLEDGSEDGVQQFLRIPS